MSNVTNPVFCVVIGVDAYPRLSPRLQLAGAGNDARGWRALLHEEQGVHAERIRVLTSPRANLGGVEAIAATRQNVLGALAWLADALASSPDARGLLAYAGHGLGAGTGLALCPSDLGPDHAEALPLGAALRGAGFDAAGLQRLTVVLDAGEVPGEVGGLCLRGLGRLPGAHEAGSQPGVLLRAGGPDAGASEVAVGRRIRGAFSFALQATLPPLATGAGPEEVDAELLPRVRRWVAALGAEQAATPDPGAQIDAGSQGFRALKLDLAGTDSNGAPVTTVVAYVILAGDTFVTEARTYESKSEHWYVDAVVRPAIPTGIRVTMVRRSAPWSSLAAFLADPGQKVGDKTLSQIVPKVVCAAGYFASTSTLPTVDHVYGPGAGNHDLLRPRGILLKFQDDTLRHVGFASVLGDHDQTRSARFLGLDAGASVSFTSPTIEAPPDGKPYMYWCVDLAGAPGPALGDAGIGFSPTGGAWLAGHQVSYALASRGPTGEPGPLGPWSPWKTVPEATHAVLTLPANLPPSQLFRRTRTVPKALYIKDVAASSPGTTDDADVNFDAP